MADATKSVQKAFETQGVKYPSWSRRLTRRIIVLRPINWIALQLFTRLPLNRWTKRFPAVGKKGILRLTSGDKVEFMRAQKCSIARQLFWSNGNFFWEQDKIAISTFEALVKSVNLFIDIGAYTGLYSLVAARTNQSCRVFAYEIIPENILVLYENVFHNDLVERIAPRLCGLSDRNGSIVMPFSLDFGLLETGIGIDWEFKSGVSIPLRTLDKLHSDIAERFMMKIDVEGLEPEVFIGGRCTIERLLPDIICEVLVGARTVSSLERQLRPLGYHFYHITRRGLMEKSNIVPTEHERDWLFSVRCKSELIEIGVDIWYE